MKNKTINITIGLVGLAVVAGTATLFNGNGEFDFKGCTFSGREVSHENQEIRYSFSNCEPQFVITKDKIISLAESKFEREHLTELEIYNATGLREKVILDDDGNIIDAGMEEYYEKIY